MYRVRKNGKWGSWLPILYSTPGLRRKLTGLVNTGEIQAFETK
jgi:hypothetical protein